MFTSIKTYARKVLGTICSASKRVFAIIFDDRMTLAVAGFMVVPTSWSSAPLHGLDAELQGCISFVWLVCTIVAWRRIGRRLEGAAS